ncbi:MAG: hypothetical protein Q9199_000660 [Rusavskia elegans]
MLSQALGKSVRVFECGEPRAAYNMGCDNEKISRVGRGRAVGVKGLVSTAYNRVFFQFIRSGILPKREIPHQISRSHPKYLIIMTKRKGDGAISQAEFGGILEAIRNPLNKSNRSIAKRYKRSEKTVRNVEERALEAEKENIDPLTPEASTAKPRSGRPFIISPRDSRRLIRQAIKSKYQRRKDWVTIAREIGIDASPSAINSAFYRAGYGRYPPRYKPQLNIQQKK